MAEQQQIPQLWHQANKEALNFGLPDDWEAGLTLVDGITIDDAKTKDRDDAIWLMPDSSGHDVQVSIANVGSFVPPDSAMSRHALALGETRYLRARQQQMLPPRLGEGALSLLDTQLSPALVVSLKLNAAGDVTQTTLDRRRIRPMRATYEEVAHYTHAENDADPRTGIFRTYEEFALNLLKARQGKGAFAYYNAEAGIMTDEEGQLIQFAKGVEHSGQLIVQEFMILANSAVALHMQRNGIPGIFRRHRLPQKIHVQDAVAMLQAHGRDYLDVALAGMGRAWYDAEAGPHEALQLPAYAQNTSPLRRYVDLVNQWNILAHMEGRDYPFSGATLADIARHLNDVQTEIRGPSQHFKEKDARVSAGRLRQTHDQLASLPPGDFHRVVKAAIREGQLPEGFKDTLARKMEAATIRVEDAVILLCAGHAAEDWKTLKTTLLQYIAGRPEHAATAVAIALTQQLLDAATSEPIAVAAGFGWRTTINRGDASFEGTGQHSQTDTARYLASLRALVGVAGLTLTDEELGVQPAAATTVRNPKSVLGEYVQGRGEQLPTYLPAVTLWTNGTEHLFESTVIVRGQEHKGQGRTKKEAETAAAAEAIQALGVTDPQNNPGKRGALTGPEALAGGNPVMFLKERSERGTLPQPNYTFGQTGPAHQPTFTAEVVVVDDGGTPRTFFGRGPNKAIAKTNAARAAAAGLQPSSSPQDGSSA